jgi:hypothetical protein
MKTSPKEESVHELRSPYEDALALEFPLYAVLSPVAASF